MRRSATIVGAVAASMLAMLGSLVSADTASADPGISRTRTVTQGASVEDRAEALGLRLEDGAIATATKSHSLQFPEALTASNGVAQLDLSQWKGYVFAFDDATQSLYISNSSKELVGVVTEFYGVTSFGEVQPARATLEKSVLSLYSDSNEIAKYKFDYFDATAPDSLDTSGQWRVGLIKVPSNYVYDPKLGSLHDYCTKSPDEFPNPFGPNADFRGPCAIHDMCYESKGCASKACDAALLVNLRNNCIATYPKGATQTSCVATAGVYYAAVTAVHIFSSCP